MRGTSNGLLTIPLSNWLKLDTKRNFIVWNEQFIVDLQHGKTEELEQYLTNFCFTLLDLSDKEQVFVARTFFISIVTDIIRTQSKKGVLQSRPLYKAYELINEIENWENISEFILGVPWYLETIRDEVFVSSPLVEECSHLEKAFELIAFHLRDQKLTVKWLAAQIGISTTHLSNLFKLKIGVTVSEYLAKRKIDEITYELIHTTNSLTEIREKYGFVSHSHFIQFFKKHKGTTPLKYKRQMLMEVR